MLCCVFFSLVRDVFLVAKKTKKTNYYNKKTIDGTTAKCVSDDGWLSHAGLFQNKSKNFAIVRQITILYMRIAHMQSQEPKKVHNFHGVMIVFLSVIIFKDLSREKFKLNKITRIF